MFKKKWQTGFGVLLAIILALTTPGSLAVFAESSVLTQPTDTVKRIEVQLNDDYFNPKVITIQNGKKTTLILKNVGNKEHSFTVEKLGIDTEVKPREVKTITVEPKMAGTYNLICRYHFREGMVGKVTVK